MRMGSCRLRLCTLGSVLHRLVHFLVMSVVKRRRWAALGLACCLVAIGLLKGTPWTYAYGCNYTGPPSKPVSLNSTYLTHYLIEESDFCHRQSNLTLVVYVHTSLSNVERRQQTRSTWASAALYDSSVRMAVVFMVGLAKTEHEQTILREESQLYHDIVQGAYIDTYHTLSYKALASVNWVTRYCSHVPWTLHADDDVLIDIFLLKRLLNNVTNDSIFGYSMENGTVYRFGKWCMRHGEYPEDHYPIYAAGPVWVMATALGKRLLHAARNISMVWIDDLYLTGLLAAEAGVPVSTGLTEYMKWNYIENEDIGQIVAWFEISDRTSWWKKLLAYYGHASSAQNVQS